MYAVNKLKLKNKMFLLPEGNPVTYYYSIAYDILNQIEEAKMLLLDSLEKIKVNINGILQLLLVLFSKLELMQSYFLS